MFLTKSTQGIGAELLKLAVRHSLKGLRPKPMQGRGAIRLDWRAGFVQSEEAVSGGVWQSAGTNAGDPPQPCEVADAARANRDALGREQRALQ
jgi:hypothetical protein